MNLGILERCFPYLGKHTQNSGYWKGVFGILVTKTLWHMNLRMLDKCFRYPETKTTRNSVYWKGVFGILKKLTVPYEFQDTGKGVFGILKTHEFQDTGKVFSVS